MEITNENNTQQEIIPVQYSLEERVQLLELRMEELVEAKNYMNMMLKGTTEAQHRNNTLLDELSDGQKKMMKNIKNITHSVRFKDQPVVEKHVYDQDAGIAPTATQKEKDKKKSGSKVTAKKPKTVPTRRSPRLLAKQK